MVWNYEAGDINFQCKSSIERGEPMSKKLDRENNNKKIGWGGGRESVLHLQPDQGWPQQLGPPSCLLSATPPFFWPHINAPTHRFELTRPSGENFQIKHIPKGFQAHCVCTKET